MDDPFTNMTLWLVIKTKIFWYSLLFQELTSIYKMLSPGQLSIRDSNRVCNALALLQVIIIIYLFMLQIYSIYLFIYSYCYFIFDESKKGSKLTRQGQGVIRVYLHGEMPSGFRVWVRVRVGVWVDNHGNKRAIFQFQILATLLND